MERFEGVATGRSNRQEAFGSRWDVNPAEAVRIQKELRERIRLEPFLGEPRLVAGADVSFNRYSTKIYAGFVVLDYDSLEVVERTGAVVEVSFPYVPGLLSFREIPPLLEAWRQLRTEPDVYVFDGQGIAHPRRVGIATHMGLLLDKPAIGCAKSLLTGRFQAPDVEAGSSSPLIDRGEQVGVVYRTKRNTKPVFISPGHRMDIESAVRLLRPLVRGYRIPEPTRQAHLHVNELRVRGGG
jgi:deoxyribonuclease V